MIISDHVARYAVRLGDDSLILGHRLSEWISHAPFLEEDIALGNVALDFVGRARLFYQYAAERLEGDACEDKLAYGRDTQGFSNLLICELPRGDFAFTMCRQFLYDAFSLPLMQNLCGSSDERLAAIAAKAEKESRYHLRRSQEWMLRLGGGTDESHRRLEVALDELWAYTDEMFQSDSLLSALVQEGVAVDPADWRESWHAMVAETFTEADLDLPVSSITQSGGRDGVHSAHMEPLLQELQYMQRTYPGLKW